MDSGSEIEVGESYNVEIISYGKQGDPIASYSDDEPVIIVGDSDTDVRPIVGEKARVTVTDRPEEGYFLGVLKEVGLEKELTSENGSKASTSYDVDALYGLSDKPDKTELIEALRDAGIVKSGDAVRDSANKGRYQGLKRSGHRKVVQALKEAF